MFHIARLINDSGLSKRAIARRAGVSASTIVRIASGDMDPTMSTATSILRALGFQLPDELPQLCDSEATRTARRMILDEPVDGEWVETLSRWADTMGELVLSAGRSAPIALRPEASTVRTSWEPLRVYGAVGATGFRWAASGWAAGAAYGMQVIRDVHMVVYVDGGFKSLGLALPNDPEGIYTVHILPFDGVSERGVQSSGGIVWADPYQVALDLCAEASTEHLGIELINELGADHE